MKLKVGDKVGRLTILGIEKVLINGKMRVYCHCKCECGNIKKIRMDSISTDKGKTQSCGCFAKEESGRRVATHRMTRSITHISWMCMRSRCNNPNNPSYEHYGAIGIKVCERWDSFENFLEDMGERPSKSYTIDRIDVNGDYEPSNCRWATAKEQQNNKHNTIYITLDGQTHTIPEWADILGIKESVIRVRLRRNKTAKECLSTVDNRKYHFK